MTLADVPAGCALFVDANVLVYHSDRTPCSVPCVVI